MNTATASKTTMRTDWTEIACAGTPYGHVPGHTYHDVEIHTRRTESGQYLARVREVWGSAQGHDEEHGRNEWAGRGPTAEAAIDAAVSAARGEIDESTRQYLSSAHATAIDETC